MTSEALEAFKNLVAEGRIDFYRFSKETAREIMTALKERDRLNDKLAAAEVEANENARIIGMSGERELALRAKLERAEAENAKLREAHRVNQDYQGLWLKSEAENAKLVEGIKRISGPCEYGWPDNEQNCKPQCNRCIARALLRDGKGDSDA